MNKTRPEILAVRAVNQYRKRDILPYMGLRYYFANRCAIRNQWATEVAIELALSSAKPAYFHAFHFKERDAEEKIVYRDLHLPARNEAFAETALLAECSKYPEVFDPLPCAFSYRLAKNDYRAGVFETYFYGFQNRHRAIAKACESSPNGFVLYTDVKKFYPSISAELAMSVWNNACEKSRINNKFRELGDKLLDHHKNISTTPVKISEGLLTGPMFSHLIGNLVLRTLARVGWSERSELQQIHTIMLDFALLSPTYNTTRFFSLLLGDDYYVKLLRRCQLFSHVDRRRGWRPYF